MVFQYADSPVGQIALYPVRVMIAMLMTQRESEHGRSPETTAAVCVDLLIGFSFCRWVKYHQSPDYNLSLTLSLMNYHSFSYFVCTFYIYFSKRLSLKNMKWTLLNNMQFCLWKHCCCPLQLPWMSMHDMLKLKGRGSLRSEEGRNKRKR